MQTILERCPQAFKAANSPCISQNLGCDIFPGVGGGSEDQE